MSHDDIPESEDEAERLHREDEAALFGALLDVMDERGLDEGGLVPLLLDAAFHYRSLAYVVATAKPSESGLRMDLDRMRKLIDEVHRDYRKNAADVVRSLIAMLDAVAPASIDEEKPEEVKPTSILSEGSGR